MHIHRTSHISLVGYLSSLGWGKGLSMGGEGRFFLMQLDAEWRDRV